MKLRITSLLVLALGLPCVVEAFNKPTQEDIEDILARDTTLNLALQNPENVKKLQTMMKYPWEIRSYMKDPEAGPLIRRFIADYKLKAAGKPFGDEVGELPQVQTVQPQNPHASASEMTVSAQTQAGPQAPVAYPAFDDKLLTRGPTQQFNTAIMGNAVSPVHLSIGLIVFGMIGALLPLLCAASRTKVKVKKSKRKEKKSTANFIFIE